MKKSIFATVGTTKFDSFVQTLTQYDVLKELKTKGYDNLTIQIGKGSVLPNTRNARRADIKLSYYRFKDSIHDDIAKSDLVISHGGAGTCLEVLMEKKPLIVVINEDLMGNHQTELAEQLEAEGYLIFATCANLRDTVKNMNLKDLKTSSFSTSNSFASYLNRYMGFEE